MQVSKFLLILCTTAVCTGFISARAQDNPAQAAARAALMSAMGSPSAPAEQTPNAPIVVESSGVVTQQTNPPAQTNQIVTPSSEPVVAAPAASDTEAQTKAREALLQQMGQQSAGTPAPVTAAAPVAPVVVAPMTASPAPAKPVTTEAKPVAASPAKASSANVVGQEAGFAPIVAPPLPISAAKEQQLDALLAQYMADQISPEQYHKQRAAILAEP